MHAAHASDRMRHERIGVSVAIKQPALTEFSPASLRSTQKSRHAEINTAGMGINPNDAKLRKQPPQPRISLAAANHTEIVNKSRSQRLKLQDRRGDKREHTSQHIVGIAKRMTESSAKGIQFLDRSTTSALRISSRTPSKGWLNLMLVGGIESYLNRATPRLSTRAVHGGSPFMASLIIFSNVEKEKPHLLRRRKWKKRCFWHSNCAMPGG